MASSMVGKTEMRQKQAARMKLRDGVEGGHPEFQGYVWRRSGRQDEAVAFDADARSVPYKGHAIGGIEIGDVVRGMARSVEDAQLARAQRECFSPFKDAQIGPGHGEEVAEQCRHVLAIKALGAGEEL